MTRIPPRAMFVVMCSVAISQGALGTGNPDECYTVATWNLEYYSFTAKRGFPESTRGGPTYEARKDPHRDAIAAAIRDTIGAKIVVLNEVDGRKGPGGRYALKDLVQRLGSLWRSRIGLTGGRGSNQSIALLWDSRYAALNDYTEIEIKAERVDGKDIFDKDPLVGNFTLLRDGESMNDLLIVGLHLASGQRNTRNHDAAMGRLRKELQKLRGDHRVLPRSEADILLAGDLNANAFDDHAEQFFVEFNRGNWRVLAEAGNYPATRLAGVPLQHGSPIDYVLATAKTDAYGGLVGEEVTETVARVWTDLIENDDFGKFREVYSDHLPVSVCVRVMKDTDEEPASSTTPAHGEA